MDKSQLKTLVNNEDLQNRIKELAEEINNL